MEMEQSWTTVREQLIVAGIDELEVHGIADFSLRRVAAACNLSCAAPYRHFRDKEAFIDAIFDYIRHQLRLLLAQVAEVYEGDHRRQLVESCVAYIRFCLANPHIRAVLTRSDGSLPLADTVDSLLPLCAPHTEADKQREQALVLRALTYGAVLLLESGELSDSEAALPRVRQRLQQEIDRLTE